MKHLMKHTNHNIKNSLEQKITVFSLVKVYCNEQPIIVDRSRRLFLATSLLLFAGCATTSKQCMSLSTGEEKMDCLYEAMFPEVVEGVAIGALAGAMLGGAVAFAMSGNPLTGVIAGGIVGGVIGGVIAYYNFTMERANNDRERALNFVYQDIKSQIIKLQRFVNASTQALNESSLVLENQNNAIEKILKEQALRMQTILGAKETIETQKRTIRRLSLELGKLNTNSATNKLEVQLAILGEKIDDVKRGQEEQAIILERKRKLEAS